MGRPFYRQPPFRKVLTPGLFAIAAGIALVLLVVTSAGNGAAAS